ncbi:glutamate mutase L [Nocardioides sp. cx-173]|uniref:glutamate mutase L n=1 Tax=Nocardioides sp. cx-173 TaxID=2898796 RepID=UPI001E39CF0E|nr:glutamate mutase L [Nocardioides sp. cx-173]MCD4525515.1 glutamate mutase L [Nocardioides sp. cx-173]UGB42659.1 glutamate mutase L [Nocardioides sp. cx-173]
MADPQVAICVDFGSTFTKASLVDLAEARIVAAAEHPTTLPVDGHGDILDGYDACLAALTEADPRAAGAEVLACSSAGGGLRIAVIGNEELVTAEAGRRVALSSGGKVVAVLAAAAQAGDAAPYRALRDAAPDVLLLTGGTDGGNSEVLLQAARDLVASGWDGPVVVAGNADAQAEVSAVLGDVPHVLADNVVPRIGVLAPDSARAAIREMFLTHVIGGKHLSPRADFLAMVRGATPDVVLTGVELLADGLDAERPGAGDVVVVDVGGATTDVHSVVELDPEDSGLSREVVATTRVTRTVEGDLGMRWSAQSTVEAANLPELADAARARTDDPGFLPADAADLDDDEAIARAAVGLALRRHAGRSRVVVSPEGRVVERTGKDLRAVDLVVGSGGVLRHGRDGVSERVLAGSVGADLEGGWQLPERAPVVVDTQYLLAAVGLLAPEDLDTAHRLARRLLAAGRV